MNGYLQRLIARELNSAPSIHPIVGSFFPAPRHEHAPESPRQEEQLRDFRGERNIPYRDRTEEAVSPVTAAKPSPFESKGAELRPSTLLPEPISRASQSPLADRTVNGVIERLMKPPGPTEQRESVREPVPPTIPELRRFDAVSQGRRFDAVSQGRMTQSIAGEASPFEAKKPSRDRLYSFVTEPKSKSAEGEPGEIQIHIGRIEVTAVQPTPAILPEPKPRHVAPSLDEYLRRRDKRTE
jgi:hypothetical protein